MNKAKLTKTILAVVPANASLCALAWALVTGHIAPPRVFEVVPMVLSVPGWFLAMAIWGDNSGEPVLSDALIVATNTFVYSVAEILLLQVAQAVYHRLSQQRTVA